VGKTIFWMRFEAATAGQFVGVAMTPGRTSPFLARISQVRSGCRCGGLLQRKTEIFVRNLQKIGIGHDPGLNAWFLPRG